MAKKFNFGVHPGVAMLVKWKATLKQKTGRDLDEWMALVHTSCANQGVEERTAWLKEKHGLGTNSAKWIGERSVGQGGDEDSPEAYLEAARGYVEAMFEGARSGLRPLYEALMEACYALGKDVKACPAKTIVPIYRNHVFAQIKPATRTRIDFGLALGGRKAEGRLIDTGGFAKKDRITHRLEVTSLRDVDDELKLWLRAAYEMDA